MSRFVTQFLCLSFGVLSPVFTEFGISNKNVSIFLQQTAVTLGWRYRVLGEYSDLRRKHFLIVKEAFLARRKFTHQKMIFIL